MKRRALCRQTDPVKRTGRSWGKVRLRPRPKEEKLGEAITGSTFPRMSLNSSVHGEATAVCEMDLRRQRDHRLGFK